MGFILQGLGLMTGAAGIVVALIVATDSMFLALVWALSGIVGGVFIAAYGSLVEAVLEIRDMLKAQSKDATPQSQPDAKQGQAT